jgi:Domain of unknown function (DUF4402)
MKKIVILFATIILISGFTNTVIGQTTLSAGGSAIVVIPISIANSGNMNFGNISVSSTVGSVILDPSGVRRVVGGATLPVLSGTVSAASFTVSGSVSSTYSISLPSSYTISSGAKTMIINAFTSNPSGTGTLSSSGSQTLFVGATLNVGAAQGAGTYTNATGFGVTVNYN